MSELKVDRITNLAGTGSPAFPFGFEPITETIPLALLPDSPASSKVTVSPSQVVALNKTGRNALPLSMLVDLSFPETTVDFQTGVTTGAPVQITIPTSTAGQYRRAGFSLDETGTLIVRFTPAAASLAATANPGTLYLIGELAIGWIDLVSTGGTTYKTSGSTMDIIEGTVLGTPTIHRFSDLTVVSDTRGVFSKKGSDPSWQTLYVSGNFTHTDVTIFTDVIVTGNLILNSNLVAKGNVYVGGTISGTFGITCDGDLEIVGGTGGTLQTPASFQVGGNLSLRSNFTLRNNASGTPTFKVFGNLTAVNAASGVQSGYDVLLLNNGSVGANSYEVAILGDLECGSLQTHCPVTATVGATGGSISIHGDVVSHGSTAFDLSGGAASAGDGGSAGSLYIGGSVAAVGTISLNGGSASAGFSGGSSGSLTCKGSLASGTISMTGANSSATAGNGGLSGSLTVGGDLASSGSVLLVGGNSTSPSGGIGGSVGSVSVGGDLKASTISMIAGSSTTGLVAPSVGSFTVGSTLSVPTGTVTIRVLNNLQSTSGGSIGVINVFGDCLIATGSLLVGTTTNAGLNPPSVPAISVRGDLYVQNSMTLTAGSTSANAGSAQGGTVGNLTVGGNFTAATSLSIIQGDAAGTGLTSGIGGGPTRAVDASPTAVNVYGNFVALGNVSILGGSGYTAGGQSPGLHVRGSTLITGTLNVSGGNAGNGTGTVGGAGPLYFLGGASINDITMLPTTGAAQTVTENNRWSGFVTIGSITSSSVFYPNIGVRAANSASLSTMIRSQTGNALFGTAVNKIPLGGVGTGLPIFGTDDATSTTYKLTSAGATPVTLTSATTITQAGTYFTNIASPAVIALATAVGKDGDQITIKNIGAGVITIDPNGSETIDGALTKLLVQYDSLIIIANAGVWSIL